MSILYMALKQAIWRVRIHTYFREIFKFRNFIETLRNFAKSVFAHIFFLRNLNMSRNNLNQENFQITCFKMTHNMFIL